jgi:tRNA nucleotidyltransferase/poly(A) polymerase
LEGAKMVKPMLKELKFSNKQIEYISELIRNHIYPSSVVSAPNSDNKVMMRYVRKMGENVIENIFLAKADRLSAQGPAVTKEMTEENLSGLDKLLNFYLEVKPTLKPLPKLLDGNEIMRMLNLKQSPLLGKIINELHEAQLNGEVNTKEEAIKFIKSFDK